MTMTRTTTSSRPVAMAPGSPSLSRLFRRTKMRTTPRRARIPPPARQVVPAASTELLPPRKAWRTIVPREQPVRRLPRRNRTCPQGSTDVNPESEDRANEVAAESQNNEVRVQFADEQSNSAAGELTPLDEIETNDDENRNKRLVNFGFGASASSGGSGTGSGNFLFDIVRQAADGAARAAGTVYRVVAGTQSLGLGLTASRDIGPVSQDAAPAAAPAGAAATAGAASSGNPPAASGAGNLPPLVTGSGSQGNSSGSAAVGKNDGTQEAVPGPVTRLFVIANRGISNLIQDLILRLAATSERIVNFKARLITSII